MSVLTTLASTGVIAYALNLMIHVTVICLVALCAMRCVLRRDPSARHLVCLAGLVCLLLAPGLVGLEARVGRSLITLTLPDAASAPVLAYTGGDVSSLAEKPARTAIDAATALTQTSILWGGWAVLSAYLLGVGWGAARFAQGYREASRLKRDVSPWGGPADRTLLHTVEQALRAPMPPVFTSLSVASPVAVGLLHPAVILPEGLAETLTPQQLRQVLLHECAHVAFRHGFGGLLERVVGVLFWPHPLVRLLCWELARAREEVCDNFASQEDGAACYARTLLAIAQGIDTAPHLASTLALLGPGTSLEARIAGLLDPRRNRMIYVKRWKLWAVTGAAILAVASTATVRVVAAQENASQNPANPVPGNNATTRVFAFQYVDAQRAAANLRASLGAQHAQPIQIAVDSRTNSVIVHGPGAQMALTAALFGRLERQAAEAHGRQGAVAAPDHAAEMAAKRLAEATALQTAVQTLSSATPVRTRLDKGQGGQSETLDRVRLDDIAAQQSQALAQKRRAEEAVLTAVREATLSKGRLTKNASLQRQPGEARKFSVMTKNGEKSPTLGTLYTYAVTDRNVKEPAPGKTVENLYTVDGNTRLGLTKARGIALDKKVETLFLYRANISQAEEQLAIKLEAEAQAKLHKPAHP